MSEIVFPTREPDSFSDGGKVWFNGTTIFHEHKDGRRFMRVTTRIRTSPTCKPITPKSREGKILFLCSKVHGSVANFLAGSPTFPRIQTSPTYDIHTTRSYFKNIVDT
jgi:hypothetical protein